MTILIPLLLLAASAAIATVICVARDGYRHVPTRHTCPR